MNGKELLEFLSIAKPIGEREVHFIALYFKGTRRKHDSGYYIFEIYGEDENRNFYNVSKCSDVIDFEKNISRFEWFASIDIPYPGIFRIFPRYQHYFTTPFHNCSSFLIQEYPYDSRTL